MPKKKFYSIDRQGKANQDDKKAKIGILSEDVMSYYRNVSTSLEQGFDGEDSKDEFLTNVYNTLRDEGVQVSQNQTVSRILEVLFAYSKPTHMQDLFCQFCGQLTIVAFDRFSSHVFQALVQYLPAMYDEKDETLEDVAWRKSFHDHVKILCDFMVSHLRDVMTHTYGSHVLRSLLEVLGGVHVKQDVVRSRVSRGQRKDDDGSQSVNRRMSKNLTEAFANSFKEITEKILRFCNFEDHLADQNYCPVLQTLMLVLSKIDPEGYKNLVTLVIDKTGLYKHNDEAKEDDVAARIPDIVQNEVGSYLIELLLSLASEKELQDIYANLFKKRIIYFAVHPIANYVLQKMLSCLTQADMMEELLNDIVPYLEDILAVNHIGIVTKLAEACKRCGSGQEDFLKALMGAFHCLEPEERQTKIAPLLASLQTYEVFTETKGDSGDVTTTETSQPLLRDISLHGSLLLQQLVSFQRPILVSSSIAALSGAELVSLACDRCGSHVLDEFFTSRTVLEKFKVAVLKKMQGSYINIACNKNGSRCLENIWKSCALKQRVHIAEDLCRHHARLEGDQWGRFLYRNFALAKFSQRRAEWTDIQSASTKKQRLIKDILEGSSSQGKKRKRKAGNMQQPSSDRENLQNASPVTVSSNTKMANDHPSNSKKAKVSDVGNNTGTMAKVKTPNNEIAPCDEASTEPGSKKKRKRKKDKKRQVRGEKVKITDETENAGARQEDNIETSEESNATGKKKKGKKGMISQGETLTQEYVKNKKKRKKEKALASGHVGKSKK